MLWLVFILVKISSRSDGLFRLMVIFRMKPRRSFDFIKNNNKRKQTLEQQQHSTENMTPNTSADGAIGKQAKCLQYYN
jgi:hypothetical protein